MYTTIGFQPLDLAAVKYHIRVMDSSALVLIKQDGRIIYGRTRTEKDDLMKKLDDTDVILFGWHGNYRTDIFTLTPAQLRGLYDKPVPAIMQGMS